MSDLRALVSRLAVNLRGVESAAGQWAAECESFVGVGQPYVDRIEEMPVNLEPFHKKFVKAFPGRDMWPLRSLEDVNGVTIHHTMSHSPLATARYIVQVKGYPTTQYHYWVGAGEGCPRYLLVDPALALWHDHTGAHPTTLSVGLAGHLHLARPPGEQLQSAVNLVHWLMEMFELDIDQVQGHNDRYPDTLCPGWDVMDWRGTFYDVLEEGHRTRIDKGYSPGRHPGDNGRLACE